MSRSRAFVTLPFLAGLLAVGAADAQAQQRRRAAPPGETPPPAGPVRQRQPYAGSWQGALTLSGVTARAAAPTRLAVTFDIADTTTGAYAGTTTLGSSSQSQNLRTVTGDSEIRWEASGADSALHVYTARLVSADSIVGTVARRDASGEGKHVGTFVLVRRRTPPRRSGE